MEIVFAVDEDSVTGRGSSEDVISTGWLTVVLLFSTGVVLTAVVAVVMVGVVSVAFVVGLTVVVGSGVAGA